MNVRSLSMEMKYTNTLSCTCTARMKISTCTRSTIVLQYLVHEQITDVIGQSKQGSKYSQTIRNAMTKIHSDTAERITK